MDDVGVERMNVQTMGKGIQDFKITATFMLHRIDGCCCAAQGIGPLNLIHRIGTLQPLTNFMMVERKANCVYFPRCLLSQILLQ